MATELQSQDKVVEMQPQPQQQQPPQSYAQSAPAGAPQPVPVQAQPAVAHNTVIVQQPPSFGKRPVNLICFNCHQNIVTRTTSELKGETWLYVILLCCLTGILCFWIPFLTECSYRTSHYCPSCNAMQGTSL